IAARRGGQPPARWTDGPAKLCLALGIDRNQNGADLTGPSGCLWIEWDEPVPEAQLRVGPRTGIDSVPEPWRSIAWRFRVSSSELVVSDQAMYPG
ncbi:MAG TPA: DNA-3-methyladenine glycosylase, partial [Levilinea sp.]|nr:DNA-3-methyladenine glycosylase [Levilinea sp.]